MKDQEKTPEKINNKTEMNSLPDKEFKALVIGVLTKLGKRSDELNEHFNKELENIKKTQSETKSSINEIKNTLEKMNSRLSGTEECIRDLEDRKMEITQSEQQKEKQVKKMKTF